MIIPAEIQSIIDQMATHLSDQKAPSVSSGNHYQCLYRSPEGLKCAIGALLSDEACEGIGSLPVMTILNSQQLPAKKELEAMRGTVDEGDFAEFLYRCQSYHDAPNAQFGTTYQDRISMGEAEYDEIHADLESLWTWS